MCKTEKAMVDFQQSDADKAIPGFTPSSSAGNSLKLLFVETGPNYQVTAHSLAEWELYHQKE